MSTQRQVDGAGNHRIKETWETAFEGVAAQGYPALGVFGPHIGFSVLLRQPTAGMARLG